jgi:predicted nucleotidyltransferase
MIRAIVAAVDPEKVILFGSHARGTTSPDSDVDLIIIEKQDFGPNRSRRAELSKIRKALFNFLVPIDILVFSETEEKDLKTLRCSVIAVSAAEGRVLYERERAA